MTLTVTSDDLALYLGVDTVDAARGTYLIGLAVDLASAIVSPLPDAAAAVILSATARAYVNPQGVVAEMAGPYQVQRPTGAIYLTRAERLTLRRLAGGGGAFTVDLLGGYVAPFDDEPWLDETVMP